MFDFLVLLYDKLGVNVLHYDYIGYGLCKENYGGPSEESTYESAEAAIDVFYFISKYKFLHEQGITNKDIIIFGTSVGSGPSCHLASKEKDLLGLVLECPFMSCVRVVTNNILLRPIDMFININKTSKFSAPVFIMHGSVDQVIAQQHGIELFASVPDKYKWKGFFLFFFNTKVVD
jgi:abhydrolase domain-containing protein 17